MFIRPSLQTGQDSTLFGTQKKRNFSRQTQTLSPFTKRMALKITLCSFDFAVLMSAEIFHVTVGGALNSHHLASEVDETRNNDCDYFENKLPAMA